MSEHLVEINHEKCVKCGLCVKDCVGFALSIQDEKLNYNKDTCIKCGHCEAVCPNNAISLTGFEDKIIEIKEQTRLDPETLMMAIRTRRTIRQFKNDEVPQEIVDQIIEAGRVTATGANAQKTSYIILKDKKAELEAAGVKLFAGLINFAKKFVAPLKSLNIDENFFFKGAPLVILVCGNDTVNSTLAAQSMAFMAEANGLGVLFSGFFTVCANKLGKIKKQLNLPKGYKVVTTLVIGYPAVKYHRTVHRKPANLQVL